MNSRDAYGSILLLLSFGAGLTSQATEGIATELAQQASPSDQGGLEKLRSAADAGDTQAQFLTGKAYWYGTGAPMDRVKAVEYYRKAAEQNHADALAGLGAAYGMGQGVEKRDEAAAADYFRRAAVLGSAAGQMNLGTMLLAGKSIEKNTEEGLRWLNKAAEQDFVKAQICRSVSENFLCSESRECRAITVKRVPG